MTLKAACEIAIDCGLLSTEKVCLNIRFHAILIFSYEEIDSEITELYKELDEIGDIPIEEFMGKVSV